MTAFLLPPQPLASLELSGCHTRAYPSSSSVPLLRHSTVFLRASRKSLISLKLGKKTSKFTFCTSIQILISLEEQAHRSLNSNLESSCNHCVSTFTDSFALFCIVIEERSIYGNDAFRGDLHRRTSASYALRN